MLYQITNSCLSDMLNLQEQLRRCLCVRLPHFLSKTSIGLIVIDSIAGIFRSENLDVNYVSRSQEFYVIASKLIEIGDRFNVAIVCTNQVSSNSKRKQL